MFHRDSPRLRNGFPRSSRSARKSCSVAAHSVALIHPPGLLFSVALARRLFLFAYTRCKNESLPWHPWSLFQSPLFPD
jgi:hypothetical protein